MRSLTRILLATTAMLMLGLIGAATATAGGRPSMSVSGPRLFHHVAWTVHNPPIVIAAPICDDANHCEYPFTGTGTMSGGLTGSYVTAGGAGVDATSTHFAVGRSQTFVGTVAGCGTGTMVMYVSEDATATGATMVWHIADGYGTADLAAVSGHGSGSVTGSDTTGTIWTIKGILRCHA